MCPFGRDGNVRSIGVRCRQPSVTTGGAQPRSQGAYGVRGAPGISPAQLAMVRVLQFTEKPDRPAGRRCGAGRLDWKHCLDLPLEDEGFDFSVLSEFRFRPVGGSRELATSMPT